MAGVLLVANRPIASAMAKACTSILGRSPANLAYIDVAESDVPDEVSSQVAFELDQLENPTGSIVFTDLFGSTPDNIARTFVNRGNVSVISGVSLPMLLKACTSNDTDLGDLTEDIVSTVDKYVVAHLDSPS